jgi:hypothetical protein
LGKKKRRPKKEIPEILVRKELKTKSPQPPLSLVT